MSAELVMGLIGIVVGTMVTLTLSALSAAKAWGKNLSELEAMRRELQEMRTTAGNTLARVGDTESDIRAIQTAMQVERRTRRQIAAEQSRGIPAPVGDEDSEP